MPNNIIIDQVTVDIINKLHPKIKKDVLDAVTECYNNNVHIRIVQGLRTFEEQDELYAQGRTKPGKIVTNSPGGKSWHNYGLGVDFCLLKEGNKISWSLEEDLDLDGQKDWGEVVAIFKRYGFGWGGDWMGKFKDYPHLDKTFGMSIRVALEKYKAKEFDEEGYIKII